MLDVTIYTWTNQGLLHTVVGTTVVTQSLIGPDHFLISSTRSQLAEVQTVREGASSDSRNSMASQAMNYTVGLNGKKQLYH